MCKEILFSLLKFQRVRLNKGRYNKTKCQKSKIHRKFRQCFMLLDMNQNFLFKNSRVQLKTRKATKHAVISDNNVEIFIIPAASVSSKLKSRP